MPELPEVETVVRDLRPGLVGRKFSRLKFSDKKLRKDWNPNWEIVGRTVRGIHRRGKWILIDLEGPYMVIHLGMTGQLTVVPASEPIQPHTHLIIDLDRAGGQLRFRDVRRFGSARVFADPPALEQFFLEGKLGPEPFEVDPEYFCSCLKRTDRNLKAILLDQRFLAGVGNIYADESLFEAGLHPCRRGRELNPGEMEKLRQAIRAVLLRAIDLRGSTIRDYIGGSGLRGKFQDEFCVYGRTGEPCPRCETPIVRLVLAGRSTHVCPKCQPRKPSRGRQAPKRTADR